MSNTGKEYLILCIKTACLFYCARTHTHTWHMYHLYIYVYACCPVQNRPVYDCVLRLTYVHLPPFLRQADHPMPAASSEPPPAPAVPPETAPPAAASEAAGQAGVAEEAPKPLARKGGPEGSGEAAEGGASAAKRIKLTPRVAFRLATSAKVGLAPPPLCPPPWELQT